MFRRVLPYLKIGAGAGVLFGTGVYIGRRPPINPVTKNEKPSAQAPKATITSPLLRILDKIQLDAPSTEGEAPTIIRDEKGNTVYAKGGKGGNGGRVGLFGDSSTGGTGGSVTCVNGVCTAQPGTPGQPARELTKAEQDQLKRDMEELERELRKEAQQLSAEVDKTLKEVGKSAEVIAKEVGKAAEEVKNVIRGIFR